MRNKKISVAFIITLIEVLCLCFYTRFLVRGFTRDERNLFFENGCDTGDKVLLKVVKNKDKQWGESPTFEFFQMDCRIINRDKKDTVSNWELCIDVPEGSYIESDKSSWNAKFELLNDKLYIRQFYAEESNSISFDEKDYFVKPESSYGFGCILHTPIGWSPENSNLYFKYTPYYSFRQSEYASYITLALVCLILMTITYIIVKQFNYMEIQKINERNSIFMEEFLKLFAYTMEATIPHANGHSERVAIYSKEIARRMKLNSKACHDIYYCALFHDLGKFILPEEVMNKREKITQQEAQIMKLHSEIGGDIFGSFESVPSIGNIIRHHHEFFDGTGYPDGLKGEDIPLYSRIICVAESFDSMTTDRCYKDKLSMEEIKKELLTYSGSRYDPTVTAILITMIEENVAPVNVTGVLDLSKYLSIHKNFPH